MYIKYGNNGLNGNIITIQQQHPKHDIMVPSDNIRTNNTKYDKLAKARIDNEM